MTKKRTRNDEGCVRARELAHDLASDYANDTFAIRAMFEGLIDFADQQRMLPWVVAGEFLIELKDWIKIRNKREAFEIQGISEQVEASRTEAADENA